MQVTNMKIVQKIYWLKIPPVPPPFLKNEKHNTQFTLGLIFIVLAKFEMVTALHCTVHTCVFFLMIQKLIIIILNRELLVCFCRLRGLDNLKRKPYDAQISIRPIWTYVTANPCYTTNTNKHDNTTDKYYKHD